MQQYLIANISRTINAIDLVPLANLIKIIWFIQWAGLLLQKKEVSAAKNPDKVGVKIICPRNGADNPTRAWES